MNAEFFKTKWNLLFAGAAAILVPVFGFIDHPYYALTALSANSDVEILLRFIVAILIAIMLIPCNQFNTRKHAIGWGIATLLLAVASVYLFFENVNYKSQKTVDYTSYNGGYVVKGDNLYPETSELRKAMEQEKKRKVNETEMFAEMHEDNDSTHVLTAAALWPKKEIQHNAKSILLIYLAVVLSFSLTAICAIQIVYCYEAGTAKSE